MLPQEDNFSEDNMHSQWDSEVFPKLLRREETMELHATLGYPLPLEPGLGLEINEDALQSQPPFKHWSAKHEPPFFASQLASNSARCPRTRIRPTVFETQRWVTNKLVSATKRGRDPQIHFCDVGRVV
eukprot:SAG31_NODE_655_length_13127_cov_20.616058_8_plen_128_part_00